MSLEQIADSSKISLRYLRAIEEGRVEKLPGGIFTSSYLRQYARAIDYPETEILASFHLQADGCEQKSADDQGKIPEAAYPTRSSVVRRNVTEFVR